MTITTEDMLLEAMTALQEVRDYLARLPSVPVTLNYVRKLNQFLDAPASRIMAQRGATRQGHIYAPVGYQLVDATLRHNTLTLTTGDAGAAAAFTLEPQTTYQIVMAPIATNMGQPSHVVHHQMVTKARSLDPGSGKNWPGLLALREG